MTPRRSNRLSDNGSLPDAAVTIYSGTVMHHRMKPRVHRFSYRVFSLLLDLDQLDEAARSSWLFSVNRFNLLSFHEKDHGLRDGTGLRGQIEQRLSLKGVAPPARILLLAYPRLLGYGFNPLSVYYTYDDQNRLTAIVYEVRNTFGGLHTYTLPVKAGQVTDAGVRQDQRKEFYVSPFVSMQQHYYFRMLPPGDSVKVRILENDPDGPLLSATFSGEQQKFSTLNVLRACLQVPLLSFKVISAIHWEAFKIWRKRVPFYPRPAEDAVDGRPSQRVKSAPLATNE